MTCLDLFCREDTMSFGFTKASDYAVRAMIHVACVPEGSLVLRQKIAEVQHIPGSFMAKILRRLVRAGLLNSCRGVNGGFSLARPASQINMLEILEAVEGPSAIATCAPDPSGCEWSAECPAAGVWGRAQQSVTMILGNTTLETLVSTPRRGGRVIAMDQQAPETYVAVSA
jgi:Rrf2 family protein